MVRQTRWAKPCVLVAAALLVSFSGAVNRPAHAKFRFGKVKQLNTALQEILGTLSLHEGLGGAGAEHAQHIVDQINRVFQKSTCEYHFFFQNGKPIKAIPRSVEYELNEDKQSVFHIHIDQGKIPFRELDVDKMLKKNLVEN